MTTNICLKCGKAYYGYPATSRVDNKTEICPLCGTREALERLKDQQVQEEIKAILNSGDE